jgi:TrmH family RNA methyltransferase
VSDPGPAPVIASRDNARVVSARRLRARKHREGQARFLIEGPRALREAIAASAPVEEIFYRWDDDEPAVAAVVGAGRDRGIRCTAVTAGVIAGLATTETPQGCVGVCGVVDVDLATLLPGAVPILVEVQDPGNLGAVLRSADAAGATGVVVTAGSVDLYNPKVVRSSAGSLFHVPIARGVRPREAVEAARAKTFRVFAAAGDGAVAVHHADLTGAVAVLFGNESRGLPTDVRALADETLRVPIRGRAESLNLAAAATVVLFEAARQREA